MNTTEEISNKIYSFYLEKLEELILLGLNKKGYIFKSKEELFSFKKRNLTLEVLDNINTYYVEGNPFLVVNQDLNPMDFKYNFDEQRINTFVEIKYNFV